MSTKLLVALTFQEGHSFTKKIQQFRSRFDEKYQSHKELHLGLVPPFEISDHVLKDLIETLIEELETFFFDMKDPKQLIFQDIKVHDFKKKKLLYLEPTEDADLEHLEDLMRTICKDYFSGQQPDPHLAKSFLTIGRFRDDLELQNAYELSRVEFREDVTLPCRSISLFKKHGDLWLEDKILISFPRLEDHFYNPA